MQAGNRLSLRSGHAVGRNRLLLILAAVCALGVGVYAHVQDAAGAPRVHLVQVSKFSFPTYVASTPADPHAIYVTERTGRVWIVRSGRRVGQPFLDLHNDIRLAANSEQGLLSLAFAPDYARSHLYYVYYTDVHGDIRLVQFRSSRTNRNQTVAGSGRVILALRHPAINHYGGQLQFGPDRHLYVSIGDGGCCGDPHNNAQRIDTLFGKILRIDPQRGGRHPYLIPHGNPFTHHHGARPEIFAYGFRNPFRFSFDPHTGAVWIGDVGQDRFEEVDYRSSASHLAGRNFGWARFEGFSLYSNRAAPGAVPPALVEQHGGLAGTHETWCAVIGGYVERDPDVKDLAGRYLFADHCTGRVFSSRITSRGRAFAVGSTGIDVPGLVSSFGVDAARRVYVASENGWVYRFAG